MQLFLYQTSTKFIKKHKGFEFVNKTSDNYKNSLKNLTELLKDEFVNPWSVSNEKSEFQVIKKSGSYYEYDGLEKKDRLNILGVLVFSIMFGVVLSKMGEQGKLMTEWFTVLLEVTMKLVEIIMWYDIVV